MPASSNNRVGFVHLSLWHFQVVHSCDESTPLPLTHGLSDTSPSVSYHGANSSREKNSCFFFPSSFTTDGKSTLYFEKSSDVYGVRALPLPKALGSRLRPERAAFKRAGRYVLLRPLTPSGFLEIQNSNYRPTVARM